MPVYRSRTVFEMAKNLRAFLSLEAGLTRGAEPDLGQQLRAKTKELQQVRDQVKQQELERSRDPLTAEDRQSASAATLRRLANGPFGSLAEDQTFKPLRIVQVALEDGTSGGGRAANRLHTALHRLGHASSMFVAKRRGGDPTVRAFKPPTDPESRSEVRSRREQIQHNFERYSDSRPKDMIGYGFTGDRSPHGDAPLKQLPPCDVVNLHWFGNLLDYRAFFSTFPRHTPVVWTLHDMNAFTGGCHWDAGCGKFNDSCGACPQLGSDDEGDLSREVWRRKREVFADVETGRLHLVSPSRWLADETRRSALLGKFPVTTIHNSVDPQTFAPRDRALARAALGIPQDAAVLLFVADSLVTVRKGFALLTEALNDLTDVPNLLLLSLGNFNPSIVDTVPHIHLGFVEDDLVLSSVYSAADVFVIPSLQDNLPQTALEAMACGTPVVGFDVGGIPDMVRPGITGELVPVKDVGALREAMSTLLRDAEKRAVLSANCRRIVIEEFSYDAQAGRYVELYRSMLGHRA